MHRDLMNIYGNQIANASTVECRVMSFNDDVSDKQQFTSAICGLFSSLVKLHSICWEISRKSLFSYQKTYSIQLLYFWFPLSIVASVEINGRHYIRRFLRIYVCIRDFVHKQLHDRNISRSNIECVCFVFFSVIVPSRFRTTFFLMDG